MSSMNNSQILVIYEEVSRLTGQMLRAARESKWDLLIALEKDCASKFTHLRTDNADQPQDAAFQRRKAELIRGMLDDDAQIRMLVEPWLNKLSGLMISTRQQSRLHQVYEAT